MPDQLLDGSSRTGVGWWRGEGLGMYELHMYMYMYTSMYMYVAR